MFKHFFDTHGLRAWAEYKACVAGVLRGKTDGDTLHRLLETFFAGGREMALHNALIASMLDDVYMAVSTPGREVPSSSSPLSSSSQSVSSGEVGGAAGVPPASYQHLGTLPAGESAESISEQIQKDWGLRLHDARTGVQAGAGAGQHGDDLASLAMAVATQLARIDKGGLV